MGMMLDAGCWMLEMTLDSGQPVLEVLEPNKAVQAWERRFAALSQA